MLKDYAEHIFLKFDENKQIRVLLELAHFIEKNDHDFSSKHFQKLKKYHQFLKDSDTKFIKMANKEFDKVQNSPRQFQIYITLLERLVGNSSKDYQFLMQEGDSEKVKKTIPVIMVLDGVRSSHNIGAIIRTAECFALEKIYIQSPYIDFDQTDYFKTAMGAQDFINYEFFLDIKSLLKTLKAEGKTIVAIDTFKGAQSYKELMLNENLVIIMGHEQFGVSKDVIELADHRITIPLGGIKNSLNVSISAGIILSEIFQNKNA